MRLRINQERATVLDLSLQVGQYPFIYMHALLHPAPPRLRIQSAVYLFDASQIHAVGRHTGNPDIKYPAQRIFRK
ncbi:MULTISPECIES: hypothetical protein [Pseudomonas]|uniref:hypothetical protein n=1 Tax=Pseudomonas TaxID=286 RepID=UPI001E4FF930|nr:MULTISPECIES: hypothetical protein [Pseudomonas]MCD5983706.1 hypothetical protein [Pseudomonas sp. CDFA 610]MCQ9472308.1 hypothetical protein [Pseudomonas alliivorans]